MTRRDLAARLAKLKYLRNQVEAEITATETELAAPRRPRREVMEHGTNSGYGWHKRHHIPFPEDKGGERCGCRAAHARYIRARRSRGAP